MVDGVISEQPIIMAPEMVRAILDGTKTQTRRTSDRWKRVQDHLTSWRGNAVHLWVRERYMRVGSGFQYEASASTPIPFDADMSQPGPGDWRPAMFMPRSASRITLNVTNIQHCRLQDLSEDDAIAEGFPAHLATRLPPTGMLEQYWDTIAKGRDGKTWRENPLVWAITFERLV